jgi:hypothetical protein
VIVCMRTVVVPPDVRDRYRAWIAEGRTVREAHGILAEWVLDPANGDGDTVVVPSGHRMRSSTPGSPPPSVTP